MITATYAARVARATLAAGGATMALDGTVPVTGYAVALPGHEQRYPITADVDILTARLAAYVDAHRAELAPAGRYLGTWVFEDALYVDVTEIFPELEPAVMAGYDRAQYAVYDVAAGRELLLTQDGSGEVIPA